jgi:hypothetical protein
MKYFIRLFNLLTLFCLMSACAHSIDQNTLVLDYKAFGPQVIAHDVIGNEWWQWDAHGAPDPTASYDVKVVIYRNIDLASVKKKFPINAEQHKDYRYLEYSQSISYLDKNIKETMETPLTGITKKLVETKQKINERLQ